MPDRSILSAVAAMGLRMMAVRFRRSQRRTKLSSFADVCIDTFATGYGNAETMMSAPLMHISLKIRKCWHHGPSAFLILPCEAAFTIKDSSIRS